MQWINDFGRFLLMLSGGISKPENRQMYWREFLNQCNAIGFKSLSIVAVISVFMGSVSVMQIAYQLKGPLVPKNTLGYIVRDTIILEFSCTLICLILAGVIGSRIASEIGNMRIGEQIDAMELMGVNAKNYLIMNKILASLITIPCLVIISMVIGIISARFFVMVSAPVPIEAFDNGLITKFYGFSVFYSLIKSAVYAFIISSVSGFFGFYVKGGSIEVGLASTKAVVVSCVLILLADYSISAILL